jgi:hypothetical protein
VAPVARAPLAARAALAVVSAANNTSAFTAPVSLPNTRFERIDGATRQGSERV